MPVISTRIKCVTSHDSIQHSPTLTPPIFEHTRKRFKSPSVLCVEHNLRASWMRLWGTLFDSRPGRLPTSHHNKCLAPCDDLAYVSPHQLVMRCDAMRSISRGEQTPAMSARHHANTGWGRKITQIPLKVPPNPSSQPSWT